MKVLVTDGENRSALAVSRSLGRRECTVFVAGKETENISACSKFCDKAFKTPDPLVDREGYKQAILRIVKTENIDVLFPMTEQSIYCLNTIRQQLQDIAFLAFAPSEQMEVVSNKYELFQRAEKLGVAIPETVYVADRDDFSRKNKCALGFPVVIKPSFSKIEDGDKMISTRVMYASDPHQLKRLYETEPALRYPSLIQEMIVGPGTGLFTLFEKDHHLALFSHRRLREKPPWGGVSVVSESVPLDGEMVENASKLLSAVGWRGVAMVEYKRDHRDGRAKLMEINGRFWGSLQLSIACGVDFPSFLLDYILGKDIRVLPGDYRVGHKLKWFLGTLDHLLITLKHNKDKLGLPTGGVSKLHKIFEFLNIFEKDSSFDVFDHNDLNPFRHEAYSYIRQLIKSGRQN